MKCKHWLTLVVGLGTILLIANVGATYGSFVNTESSTGSIFTAFTSSSWTQTSEVDFNAGVPNKVDTSSSPGNVQLGITTVTFGDSANDAGAATGASAVYTQMDSYAAVPYNGTVVSWTYYGAGTNSTDARLEFLSGSANAWTMKAKSNAVTITGTDTFTVSIPVRAGWQLGIYSGSEGVKYQSTGGTVAGRAQSGDFDIGATESDFSQSAGHLALTADLRYYYSSGTIASQVLDTGTAGAKWDALFWDQTLPAGTGITFEVRASDVLFAKGDLNPSWATVGGAAPVTAGLPSGRYKQWRATLTTTDTSATPTLAEVRVYYH